jgi:hypothetical protein
MALLAGCYARVTPQLSSKCGTEEDDLPDRVEIIPVLTGGPGAAGTAMSDTSMARRAR